MIIYQKESPRRSRLLVVLDMGDLVVVTSTRLLPLTALATELGLLDRTVILNPLRNLNKLRPVTDVATDITKLLPVR